MRKLIILDQDTEQLYFHIIGEEDLRDPEDIIEALGFNLNYVSWMITSNPIQLTELTF